MKLQADFSVTQHRLNAQFGAFRDISDGGFERGFAEGEAAGYEKGYTDGQEQGYVAGQQAEWSSFWDAYQDYGNRTDYRYAFRNWPFEKLHPKYDIKPVGNGAEYMFSGETNFGDLEALLAEHGVKLDTSQVTNGFRMFNSSQITVCPELDLRKCTNMGEMFQYSTVDVIRKIILNEDGNQDISIFHGSYVKEVRFEGIIGVAVNLKNAYSLSNDSVQSIIDHLKDLTGETAKTITFKADIGANITDAQKATVSAKNWTLVY